MTDLETLVCEYMRQHPKETMQEVVEYFCNPDEEERIKEVEHDFITYWLEREG